MPARANHLAESESLVCPSCGSHQVSTRMQSDAFEYGGEGKRVQLRAVVPLHCCSSCELEFTDHRAEELRHDAVCEHLNVLAPQAICAIRKRHGLSRAQFADVTRLGTATLARWESGEVIQNAALDIYLRLIARDEIFSLLKNGSVFASPGEVSRFGSPDLGRFPALEARQKVAALQDRARLFRLAA